MKIEQMPPMPALRPPILSIGAGGIVGVAHLPAYRLAALNVKGIYDINLDSSTTLAQHFAIPYVATSLEALIMLATEPVIYDVAVPGSEVLQVLNQLPERAYILIQKPLGETLAQAREIVAVATKRQQNVSVNFQLRYAPYSLALKHLIAAGELGIVHDIEVNINVLTPWSNWPFLEKAPRMEMVYHSIHYLDFIRQLMGEPRSVLAKSIKDPAYPRLESSRSSVILDYGELARATVHTFHSHLAGPKHQQSSLKVEGTKGVARIQMGLNLDYPVGGQDIFEFWRPGDEDWRVLPLTGSWIPHAFCGPMAAMMIWQEGGSAPSTELNDALKTMMLVDAAYRSSDQGGIRLF